MVVGVDVIENESSSAVYEFIQCRGEFGVEGVVQTKRRRNRLVGEGLKPDIEAPGVIRTAIDSQVSFPIQIDFES